MLFYDPRGFGVPTLYKALPLRARAGKILRALLAALIVVGLALGVLYWSLHKTRVRAVSPANGAPAATTQGAAKPEEPAEEELPPSPAVAMANQTVKNLRASTQGAPKVQPEAQEEPAPEIAEETAAKPAGPAGEELAAANEKPKPRRTPRRPATPTPAKPAANAKTSPLDLKAAALAADERSLAAETSRLSRSAGKRMELAARWLDVKNFETALTAQQRASDALAAESVRLTQEKAALLLARNAETIAADIRKIAAAADAATDKIAAESLAAEEAQQQTEQADLDLKAAAEPLAGPLANLRSRQGELAQRALSIEAAAGSTAVTLSAGTIKSSEPMLKAAACLGEGDLPSAIEQADRAVANAQEQVKRITQTLDAARNAVASGTPAANESTAMAASSTINVDSTNLLDDQRKLTDAIRQFAANAGKTLFDAQLRRRKAQAEYAQHLAAVTEARNGLALLAQSQQQAAEKMEALAADSAKATPALRTAAAAAPHRQLHAATRALTQPRSAGLTAADSARRAEAFAQTMQNALPDNAMDEKEYDRRIAALAELAKRQAELHNRTTALVRERDELPVPLPADTEKKSASPAKTAAPSL